MSDAYYLSEADVELFRAMAAEFRSRRPVPRYPPPYDEHQAPEVYAALTPAGGIPGISNEPGTGTNLYSVPGSAFCQVYRVLNGTTVPLGVDSLGNIHKKQVYNLGSSAIPGGAWIDIKRDKWGTWLAGTGGGGIGAPGSGTSIEVVTAVSEVCTEGVTGISYSVTVFSAFVSIGGVNYPVTFY